MLLLGFSRVVPFENHLLKAYAFARNGNLTDYSIEERIEVNSNTMKLGALSKLYRLKGILSNINFFGVVTNVCYFSEMKTSEGMLPV